MKLTFSEDPALWNGRFAALKMLAASQVDVGLTSSASGRSQMLLAIHEHGAPAMRIPARPVIQPALAKEEAREAMTAAMVNAMEAAMNGNKPAVMASLEDAGKAGVAAIHDYMDGGIPPPNSPVTVSGGWVYNRVARKGVPVEGKGFNKPLVDTRQLYNDFDYETTGRLV